MAEIQEFKFLDFSGGLNTTAAIPLIGDNESQSATNVFVNEGGGAETRYGYIAGANAPFAGGTSKMLTFRSVAAITADVVLASDSTNVKKRTGGGSTGTWDYIGFNLGTATFTSGSPTVTRATGATDWRTQIAAGDTIRLDADGTFYTVSVVGAADSLTLTGNWAGTTATGAFMVPARLQPSFGPPDGVMFKDKLYFGPASSPTTGSSGLYSYDGTIALRIASSPVLNRLARHKNYIFGVNNKNTTTPSRQFWCTSLDPDTWPASNFVDISPNDGDVVRVIIPYNDVLVSIKDSNIFYLTGEVFDPANPTYALRKLINPHGIGTMQGSSAKVFLDKLLFLGQDGIYALDGTSKIVNISRAKVNGTIKTILNRAVEPASGTTGTVCAEVFDNKYWLSVQTQGASTANDRTIVIDDKGAFTLHTIGVNDFKLVRIAGNPGVQLVGALTSAGTIITMDGTDLNDGASAISSTWLSKAYVFGDFQRTSHVREVWVAFQNFSAGASTLAAYDDNGTVTSAATVYPSVSTQFVTVQKLTIERDTNTIYIGVTCSTASKKFRVLAVMFTVRKQAQASGNVVT